MPVVPSDRRSRRPLTGLALASNGSPWRDLRRPELLHRLRLDLADALPAQREAATDLFERVLAVRADSITEADNLALSLEQLRQIASDFRLQIARESHIFGRGASSFKKASSGVSSPIGMSSEDGVVRALSSNWTLATGRSVRSASSRTVGSRRILWRRTRRAFSSWFIELTQLRFQRERRRVFRM